MLFTTNSKKFSKFVKQFKLDPSLYFTILFEKIVLKVIDFKQCLGVIEGEYNQKNNIVSPLYFKVDYLDLINKLEYFENDVVFQINELYQSVKLTDPEDASFEYHIRCETGPKIKKYCELKLVEKEFLDIKVSFDINATHLNHVLKKLAAVDSVLKFKFYRNHPTHLIYISSKKLSSLGNLGLNKPEVKNYYCNIDEAFIEIEFFYLPLFSIFLKEEFNFKVELYENFLVLKRIPAENAVVNENNLNFENNSLWIPIRNL